MKMIKSITKLLTPAWKKEEFNPEKEIKRTPNAAQNRVEEIDSALVEIELRDR